LYRPAIEVQLAHDVALGGARLGVDVQSVSKVTI